jgi:hydroxyethylthiazole kinase-like uncharacterized protein yjeF
MQPVVTAAQARELDRTTIEDVGLPGIALMETAGRACAEAARRMLGDAAGHVAVVCGPGNNGGDGYVVARVLRAAGIDAACYLAVRRDAIAGDAAAHLVVYERSGGEVRSIASADELSARRHAIAGAALCVDALFGVGLARPISGQLAAIVATINEAPRRLAVDIPSGLDADTGAVLGCCVRADRTVTMAAHKVALASAPGFAWCGEVEVCDIGVPGSVVVAAGLGAGLVEDADVVGWLPRASALDHKGTRGHVLVIGGVPAMRGAGRLAARAALRCGAGLVTLAGDGEVVAPDSVMTRWLDGGPLGDALAGKAAVVIGPGLGRGAEAAARLAEVLAAGVPAVIDADALNLIAAGNGLDLATAAGPVAITPHPAEAARLLRTTVAAVEADRLAAARALAAATRAVVVLKGARTVVCDGTHAWSPASLAFCSINPTGGPALATGGTGDVLAGAIGGLIAQRLAPINAARVAVFLHGRAGDRLSHTYGERGLMSSDLPDAMSAVACAITRPA